MSAMDFHISCKNEGQRMALLVRAEYRNMLEHNAKVKVTNPDAFELYINSIFFPRHERIHAALTGEITKAMARQYDAGPPPFVIDLKDVSDKTVSNPAGLNVKNEGSLLTRGYGLKGLYDEANPISHERPDNRNSVIDWEIWLSILKAQRSTFWDVFINLEDM